jgi:polysaccharide pyruvyl transferase WcaK-like protein
MLRVAARRVRELWPEAVIGVITDAPERLAVECPGTIPVPATGRNAWLEVPVFGQRLHGLLPQRAATDLRRFERLLRARWPRAATIVVRARERLKGSDSTELSQFLEWSGRSDVVFVTGAGLLTDEFATRAISVLALLDLALRRGATTVLMGQGVSRLTDTELLRVSRQILPRVDLIGLREERTGRPVLAALGVPDSKMITTGDDALELAYTARQDRLHGCGLGVAIRVARYSGISDEILNLVSGVVKEVSARRSAPLIPIPISRAEDDAAVLHRIFTQDQTVAASSPIELVRRCKVVVAGSYHAAVFALAQGIPAVGLAASEYYLQKFEGLAGQFGQHFSFVRLDDRSAAERLRDAVDGAWESAEELRTELLADTQRQIVAGRKAYAKLPGIAAAHRPIVTPSTSGSRASLARLADGLRRRTAPLLVAGRKFNCDSQSDPDWDERAQVAVGLLNEVLAKDKFVLGNCLRIADLGCGNERLRRALQAGLGRAFSYKGYDRRPQSPTVEWIDLRRDVPAQHFDAIFCLGLLEYIPDVASLARRLGGTGTIIIVSYVIADSKSGLTRYDRWARQWRHSYTRAQFENIFRRAGLLLEASAEAENGATVLWAWRSRL